MDTERRSRRSSDTGLATRFQLEQVLNDFDLDMEYTIDVRIRCGCPADCDNTGPVPQCQGVPSP